MRRFKVYLPFTLNTFQRYLSYKANAIIFMTGEWLMLIVTYFLWKAIFSSSPEKIMNGFSFNEMIVYLIISFLTTLITSVDIAYEISREVRDGSIAINLIRPISYEKRMLFQTLGSVLYNFTIIFAAAFSVVTMIVYSIPEFQGKPSILLYLASAGLGMMINFYFTYGFGLLSFKITNMWGASQIVGAVFQLLSGSLVPLVFFPEVMQKIFSWFPFGSIVYTPTMIYLGKLKGLDALYAVTVQLGWVLVMMVSARLIWKSLVKNLSIMGG